ncbi:monocarboxylate transporter 4 [Nematostella vectensis]|uniref:monocarboxylate transporter 4 n=1 Tax=Nematostella vectensis TaxID=45351 RepID=UPI00207773AA|nr:monocarboxylate transporter 4 [Nematostella vectensis]
MPRKRGIGVCGWIDWSLWKIPTFTVFTLASGLATLAAFIPQFFMVAYCKELGISADRAAWMYVYMGVASLIGHVAIGRLIDRPSIQPGYVYQVCWAIAGVSTLLSRLSTSYAYLSVYFVVFGFAFGAAITCCDVIMLTLVPEARGGTLGMHMMAMALPTATGTPLAGLVADVTHSYADTFYISGATILCAACIPFLMLYFRRSNYGHVTTDVNNVAVLNA